MRRVFLLLAFFMGVFGVGLFLYQRNKVNLKPGGDKLAVATSFYPMYYFASRIGGLKVDVVNITPFSVEPHDYEPTTSEIVRILQSDMLVLNGGGLEPWGDKIKEEANGGKLLVVSAGEGEVNRRLTEGGNNISDPHVWLDPVKAEGEVWNIERGYEKIDPQNASYFKANADKLVNELNQIDQDYVEGLHKCLTRDFVTSHAAFGYLASRYNLNQIAISGISPDQEPSSQTMAQIAKVVRNKNIRVIFFESLVSPKLSEAIASETGARVMVLDPIEGISDNDINRGHTYLTVMRDNLYALENALQCRE